MLLNNILRRKANCTGDILGRNCSHHDALEDDKSEKSRKKKKKKNTTP